MPANAAPIYSLTPILALGQVSAANTNRDGTGTVVDITTGSTNGRRIDRITVTATVTTTAGMVRLYLYDGSVVRLWREVTVAANTVSATNPGVTTTIVPPDPYAPLLVLPSAAHVLRASTHNAEAINVLVFGGDY